MTHFNLTSTYNFRTKPSGVGLWRAAIKPKGCKHMLKRAGLSAPRTVLEPPLQGSCGFTENGRWPSIVGRCSVVHTDQDADNVGPLGIWVLRAPKGARV